MPKRIADAAGMAGAHSGGEMPVPIPNTEAKPARADGTGARPGAGRAGRRGHAGRIRSARFVFQGRPEAPPRDSPERDPRGGLRRL